MSVTQKNTSEGFLGTSTPIKKSWKIKHAGNALESYIKKLVLDDDVTKKAGIIPWSKVRQSRISDVLPLFLQGDFLGVEIATDFFLEIRKNYGRSN